MPASVYECMFLLDPTKTAGDIPGAAKNIHAVLEKHNAEVLASRLWDDRRLAYPVNGHKKGIYYLIYYRSEGPANSKIAEDMKLNESVLRSLTIRIDPKMVDIMLALARDEHAVALQSVNEQSLEDDLNSDPRPRRRDDRDR